MVGRRLLFPLLVTFVANALAVPSYEDWTQRDGTTVTQCSISCSQTANKFSYTPGKTYQYAYESNIKTSVAGTSAEHSSLHMTANVHVEVTSACEMVLRLTDVTLQDSDPSRSESRQYVRDINQFRQALQDKPLSFAFNDGQIVSVCPRTDDEAWSVNIKRGILSSLQNTMTSLQGVVNTRETDVSGNCPTKYQVSSSSAGWSHVTRVKKTKDLLGCTDRQSVQSVFQGTPYDTDSKLQSTPLLKSTYSCDQDIDNRRHIITTSTCTETHAFRPFAKSESGAITELEYKLTFRSENNGVRPADSSSRVRGSLLFDHTLTSAEMSAAMREAQQTLAELCRLTQNDVRPQAPQLFTKFVHQLKRLDTNSLRQFHVTAKSGICAKAEQMMRDSLPVVGTSASVILMKDLISSQQATESETKVWITSFAFVKNPTTEMIQQLRPLLSSHFVDASLAVSSLLNTFCQQTDCSRINELQQIVRLFENELRYNCRTQTNDDTSRMLIALRSIGNAGRASSRAAETLNRCAGNDAAPVVVRVAAISAFRRIDCTADNRDNMLRILESRQLDSELRINAYLSAMQCVNERTLSRVQRLLETEDINQVGSFIWTHLTNLQETTSPLKTQIREIVTDVELNKRFDMDKRKFSRNVELSTFSELLNVGANVESNLIWSANSFVPRSAMLNLTVDMFGKSVNLLEVGGRVQGIEDLLEQLFGPDSRQQSAGDRERRALVRNDIFNSIDRRFDKSVDTDQLSYYLRIFGNDIVAKDFFQFDLEALKSRFNYLEWLIELAREHNIDVTRNLHFLDASLAAPTGTGMPLRLNAEGSATVGLKARGKVDIRQMFASPSTFDISGSLKPSAAVEVSGEMGVDAFVAKTGLKTVDVLHTSTVLDGAVQLRDGKVFNFDFNTPQERIEIFTAESHVYITYRDQEREQTVAPSETWQWRKCTGQTVTEKLGLELCGEIALPSGRELKVLPLLGPANARIYLTKRDTMRSIHFDASYSQADGADVVQISFNTPGSRVDREFTTRFHLNRQERQVTLNVRTPWKRINAEAGLVNRDDLKQLTIQAVFDETQQYSFTAELQIEQTSRREVRYSPKVEIAIPDRPNILFDGTVSYTRRTKAEVNLALKNAFSSPVTVQGLVRVRERRSAVKYDVSVQVGSPIFKGTFSGYTMNTRDEQSTSWASRLQVMYQCRGRRRERIIINHKIRDQSTSNLKTYSMDSSWTTSFWPRYNGQAGLELSFSPNSLRTKIEAGLDNVRKVTIITSAAYDVNSRDKKINGLFKFMVPFKDRNYELKLDHINNWEMLQSNASMVYGTTRDPSTASLDVGLKKQSNRPLNVVGEARLRYPGQELSLTNSLTERAPREYSNVLSVQARPRFQMNVVSSYRMLPRHEFTNDIRITDMEPIRLNGHLKPQLRNMQARVDVGYRGKTYLADASWLHRGTLDNFNTRASAEVGFDRYSGGFSSEVSRRGARFSGSVEAKLNQDKRVAVSGEATASLTAPDFKVRVEWWPRNFLEVTGGGKYERGSWHSSSRDLEGSVRMTSSVPGYEQLGGRFVHDRTSNGFATNGEVSWAANKKLSGTLSLDDRKTSLILSTPFDGYRSVKAETSYSRRGLGGTIVTRVEWDGRQMTLRLEGDVSQPSRLVSGRLQFTSPFDGFQAISASVRHNINGNNHRTEADFSWGRGRQITLQMNMNHQHRGCSGELTVTTPFPDYRTNKLTWQHEHSDYTWKCHHELQFDSRKFVVDINAGRQMLGTTNKFLVKASFQCPPLADWLRSSAVDISFQYDTRSLRGSGKSEVSWGRYRFGLEHELTVEPNAAFVFKTKVTTPFRGFEQLGIGLNNRKSGNSLTANNELLLGRYGRATLDGSLNYRGYNFDGTIRMTTPIRGVERVAANVRNAVQNDGVWAAHGDLQYQDKRLSADGKLGWQSQRKSVELEVSTPFRELNQMKFAAEFRGTPRNFEITSELQHNMFGSESIVALVTSNTVDVTNMHGRVTVRTPFREFSNFKAEARYQQQNERSWLATANWECNRYKGSLFYEGSYVNVANFAERLELEYINDRKIELSRSLRVEPNSIIYRYLLKTPFENLRIFSVNFNEEGPIDNFKASAEVVYNYVKKFTADAEFQLTDQRLRSSFLLTTPFDEVRRLAANVSMSGGAERFDLEGTYELNGQRITESMNFQLMSGYRMRLTGRTETPFDFLRSLTYAVNHNGDWRNFNNDLLVTYDGQQIRAKSEFNVRGPSGKFELRTPYSQLYSFVANFQHTTNPGRSFAGWSNRASLEFNGRRFAAASECTGNVNGFSATASLSTPFERYSRFTAELTHRGNPSQFTSQLKLTTPFDAARTLIVSLNHRGDATDLSSDVTVTLNEQRFNGALVFKNNRRSTEMTLTVQTPYQQYSRFQTTFNLNRTPRGFSASATVDLPFPNYRRFSAELNHNGDVRNFQTTGKLETPFDNDARSISFSVDHSSSDWSQIRTNGQLTLPSGSSSAAFSFNGQPSDFRTSLTVRTPYRGYSEFAVNVQHEGNWDSLRTSVAVQTPISGYENFGLSWSKTGNMRHLQLGAELTTPIRRAEKTSIRWNHQIDNDRFELKTGLETSCTGYEKFALTVSHRGRQYQYRTSCVVETSIPGYSKFGVTSEFRGGRDGWRWAGSAETSLRGYESWSGSVEHGLSDNGDGFKTTVQLTTPVDGYRQFGATMSHSGIPSRFQTSLVINLPFRTLPQVDVTLTHRGGRPTDFHTTLSIGYAGKKIESEVSFRMGVVSWQNYNYEGSLRLAAECPYFRDIGVSASHNRQPHGTTGTLQVTWNGEKKVDFDYRYSTSGDRNININVRSPYPMSTDLNVARSGQGSAVFNWDTTNSDRQVRFDFGLKNVQTASVNERSINFKTMVARRVIGFNVGYKITDDAVTSRGEFLWDRDAESDFVYDVQLSRTSRPGTESYDGRFQVTSYLFNTDSSFSHRITAGSRRYITDIVLDGVERLTIKSDLNLATAAAGYSHTLTIQHPRLSRDITLLTEGRSGNFKTTLTYERHSWMLEGSLTDESTSNRVKHSGALRLHSPTNLFDVQLSGDVDVNYETISVDLSTKYLTSRDRQLKTLALKTEINKLRKELKFELETPIDTLRISTANREINVDTGVVRYDVITQCGRFNVRGTIDFSLPEKSLNIKYYYTSADYVQLFGQVVSPMEMTFEASHTRSSHRINDAHVSLTFSEDEHLLTGRTQIRPDLWDDVGNYFRSQNFDTRRLRGELRQFGSVMDEDVRYKKHYLTQSITVPLTNVGVYFNSQINNKLNQVTAAFNAMYRANEFYIRDIHQALQRHYDDLSRRMHYKMLELKRQYTIWSERVNRAIDAISEPLLRFQRTMSYRVSRWWQSVVREWEPALNQVKASVNDAMETAKRSLMDFVDRIRNNPQIQALIDKLTSLDLSEYFIPPSEWKARLTSYVDQVDNWIQELSNSRELRAVRDWILNTIQNNKWLYEFTGFERQVNELIAEIRSLTWDDVKTKAREFVDNYLQLHKTRWTVWDPQRGEYAFQVYVPFDLPDMSLLKHFDPRPFIQQIKDWIIRQLPDEELTLPDIIYMYKPSTDVNNWVPPFKSHATLAGPQHYMTFDRRFYEFAGECSYLLARDFISGTFSLIVNYDRPVRGQPVKKSITVVTSEHQIEVFPDAKVTVDGSRVEMPAKVANTTVLRSSNSIRVVDDFRGVDLTCDLPHDHCTLAVSGWYYGKTAGLFGTYDNEPSNDLMTIDKSLRLEPEAVADSWTVGRRCQSVNQAITVRPEPHSRRYRACSELFQNETSLFRSCARIVDPQSFMTICLNDAPTSDNSLTAEVDTCRAAAAYVHECQRFEVYLRMPKQCVRCEVPDTGRVFHEMETVKLEDETDIPSAADVVFVIQHAICNRDILGKLTGLVDSLDNALQSEGITSTQYAVVGFGSRQSYMTKPHVHTMEGQLFNSANKLTLAINGFDLQQTDSPDALSAVRFAAQLPFRAGASKSIFLLACDSCQELESRYSDVQRLLLDNDIRLHVIVQEPIRLKSRSPKTAYIYGVDEETVYTRKDVAGDELTGEPDLRRYIRLPKDLCVALTQDTDGSVFSVRLWLDSRPMTQKQFVDVLVRTAARKAEPTDCQYCQCTTDSSSLVGVSQCSSCEPRDPMNWLLGDIFDSEDFEDDEPVGDPDTTQNISKIERRRQRLIRRRQRLNRTRRPPRVTRKPVVRNN